MKNIGKTTSSISIAILILSALYATTLLSSLFVAPVAAADIISTPIGKTINVTSGQNFTLPFMMKFDNGTTGDGFFSVTFYWDVNETEPSSQYWNFTYQSHIAKFVDNTAFSGTINASVEKDVPYGYPSGYYRYTVQVFEAYGEAYGTLASPKDFWVNVTVRAAGQGASYINHTGGLHNITISSVRCYEDNTVEMGPGNVTINVSTGLDVAVTDVKFYSPKHCGIAGSPKTANPPNTPLTMVFPTWNDLKVNVTVKNLGDAVTTTVKAYWNTTLIGSTPVILASGAETTVTLGPFSIPLSGWAGPPPNSNPALAIPVPKPVTIKGAAETAGDMNVTNNEKLYPYTVKLKWPGDATGDLVSPAKTVEILDLIALTDTWYKPPGNPMYDPQCDFDGDGSTIIQDLITLTDWWYKI